MSEPVATAAGLHINVLEFLALILNLWFMLWLLHGMGPCVGEHIVQALADNRSALSWMWFASHSHSPPVHHLAHFAMALILFTDVQAQIMGVHLPGKENVGADALSHVHQFPLWGSAITACSQLQGLLAY